MKISWDSGWSTSAGRVTARDQLPRRDTAAAAAKSLQPCLTLCDPIVSSPWGFSVSGILQARILEWVAIFFSNAWKWKVKGKSPSRAQLLVTPWTAAHQAPPSMGLSRQEYIAFSQKRHMAHLRKCTICTPRKQRGREREAISRSDCACQAPVTWAARTWEGHKTQTQPSLHLWGVPEYLNLSGLNLGSAYNPGPASDSSRQNNLEPKQCRQGKHTHHEGGKTQSGWDTENTCQCYFFAVFLPPHSTTEQVRLKKVSTTGPLCQGEKRHWRDQQTEEAKTTDGTLKVTGTID